MKASHALGRCTKPGVVAVSTVAEDSQHGRAEWLGEVELILAEKRTALSLLRTGIAILALPLSVLSFLVATSQLYDARNVLSLLIALLSMCVGLTLLGIFLVVRAVLKIHAYDSMLNQAKLRHRELSTLLR